MKKKIRMELNWRYGLNYLYEFIIRYICICICICQWKTHSRGKDCCGLVMGPGNSCFVTFNLNSNVSTGMRVKKKTFESSHDTLKYLKTWLHTSRLQVSLRILIHVHVPIHVTLIVLIFQIPFDKSEYIK